MIINYIYLILILILICSINYFIYLSYEYRGTGSGINMDTNTYTNTDTNTDIENFLDLRVFMPGLNNANTNTQIRTLLQTQQNQLDNEFNKQIAKLNNKNSVINSKLTNDTNNIKNLLIQKQALEPETQTFPIEKLIKTIKSNYNSQYLSLFANDINKYGVLINDKCFTVNGLCKDEFCIQKCQNNLYASPSQKFYTDRITSDADITRLLKVPADKINSKNVYPFNIFRSTVNDKCLSINNDGIGIEDCNLNSIHQQWMISPDENICILK